MTWDDIDRIKALIETLEEGGHVPAGAIKEALLILLKDASDRFYSRLD